MSNKFKKESSGLYMLSDRKTLPPPTKVKFRPSGVIIGSKIPPPASASGVVKMPPPPAKVDIPPLVEDKMIELEDLTALISEEPEIILSKETQKIKMMLSGRAPEINTTGIDYNKFIEGIMNVKKIPDLKETDTGKEIKVMVIETKYGSFILSNISLQNLRHIAQKLINYENTGRRMKIPLTASRKWIYLEEVVDKNDPERPSMVEGNKISDVTGEVSKCCEETMQRLLLQGIGGTEIENIINKLEEEKLLVGHAPFRMLEKKITDNEVFDIHLTVKMNDNSEYWIFIREHGSTSKKFSVPDMDGLVEVELGLSVGKNYRKYAVLRYRNTVDEPVSFDPIN